MVHGLETLERLNRKPDKLTLAVAATLQKNSPKRAVVANCTESGEQALYVDGVLTSCDSTIYAIDIVQDVGGPGVLMTLEQWDLDSCGNRWPQSIEDLPPKNDD